MSALPPNSGHQILAQITFGIVAPAASQRRACQPCALRPGALAQDGVALQLARRPGFAIRLRCQRHRHSTDRAALARRLVVISMHCKADSLSLGGNLLDASHSAIALVGQRGNGALGDFNFGHLLLTLRLSGNFSCRAATYFAIIVWRISARRSRRPAHCRSAM